MWQIPDACMPTCPRYWQRGGGGCSTRRGFCSTPLGCLLGAHERQPLLTFRSAAVPIFVRSKPGRRGWHAHAMRAAAFVRWTLPCVASKGTCLPPTNQPTLVHLGRGADAEIISVLRKTGTNRLSSPFQHSEASASCFNVCMCCAASQRWQGLEVFLKRAQWLNSPLWRQTRVFAHDRIRFCVNRQW